MGNPQLEDGYTRIANEIMEALARYRIPGEQRQVLDVIIRKTYGFNKKWDMISNSQFVKATGLKKPNICRAINGLIGKNLVIKRDNSYIPSYRFNKKYKSWKVLSKKITVIKKDNKALSKKIPTKDISTKDNKGRFEFLKKVPVPKDFHLTGQMIQYAKEKRYNACLKTFTEKMIKSAESNGYKYKNWYSAWQNWLLRDIERNPNHQDKERELV